MKLDNLKVAVTGGRDYKDKDTVLTIFKQLKIKKVAVGCCPTGLDKIIRDNFDHKEYHANWERYGLSAGPRRNKKMLKKNPKSVLIAFPGYKGTKNCIEQALHMGMVVLKVCK